MNQNKKFAGLLILIGVALILAFQTTFIVSEKEQVIRTINNIFFMFIA